MRFASTSFAVMVVAAFMIAPVFAGAQGKGHGAHVRNAPPPHRVQAPHQPHAVGTTGRTQGHPHVATPKPHGAPHTAASPAKSAHVPGRAIARKITSQPALAARVAGLLPTGMSLESASSGFRNHGQFIAALHVSRNLNIPFAQLKADMVDRHMSLGQSIQALQPSTDTRDALRRAEAEARADLNEGRKRGHHR